MATLRAAGGTWLRCSFFWNRLRFWNGAMASKNGEQALLALLAWEERVARWRVFPEASLLLAPTSRCGGHRRSLG